MRKYKIEALIDKLIDLQMDGCDELSEPQVKGFLLEDDEAEQSHEPDAQSRAGYAGRSLSS